MVITIVHDTSGCLVSLSFHSSRMIANAKRADASGEYGALCEHICRYLLKRLQRRRKRFAVTCHPPSRFEPMARRFNGNATPIRRDRPQKANMGGKTARVGPLWMR